MDINNRSDYRAFIAGFVVLKVLLNVMAMPHYGFHRDELLHLVLADHLNWGYKEVPPFIAVLAYLTKALFGSSLTAARVFTTACAGLIVWLTGLIVTELGGRKFAITLACGSLILAPAFAASQYLFQPVVFDQFWWVLSAWLTLKYINTGIVKYLYWLGVAVGFGMLTKYSMAFFAFALLLGVFISSKRNMLFNWHTLGAVAVASVIFLPNVIWQFQHNIPFLTHMKELDKQQLHYNKPEEFVTQQFIIHGVGLFIWLGGLLALLFGKAFRNHRFIAFTFLLVFLILLVMNGKVYYLFGAYPMLFAAGAVAIENLFKRTGNFGRTVVTLILLAPHVVFLPMVLPVLPIKQALVWFDEASKTDFLRFIVTWEDRRLHATTQDYADMFGWDEMAKKTADAYNALPPEQQRRTIIFASNYGQAGAIHQYHRQYHMPDAISLNSSFALWAPPTIQPECMIYIDDTNTRDVSDLAPYTDSVKFVGMVEHKLARERGTGIFILYNPHPEIQAVYQKHWRLEQMK